MRAGLKDIDKISYNEPLLQTLPVTFGKLIYSATSLIISLLSLINLANMTIDDANIRTCSDTVYTQPALLHLFEYLLQRDDKAPLETACNYIQSAQKLNGQMIAVGQELT